jgi:2-polyprenyl-3-methyl-5-hydroxy-6-metoxy-1,4-benzoquinol methylase
MKDTGERHILTENFAGAADYYIHLLHIASYEYALQYAQDKIVLDYGCGSGYGTKMLAEKAKSVTGVDISEEAIAYAQENFQSENLIFANIDDIKNQKFDVIISFQVIEHIQNTKEYLKKLKSWLNPNGILVITTPERKGRIFKLQKPWNIYHIREYSIKSMSKLLSNYFSDFEILKISSNSNLVQPEINRRAKQRLITLPCTLFFYPDFLRIFLLKSQAFLFNLLISLIRRKKNENIETNNHKDLFLEYSSKDIIITKETNCYTDMYAVCKNKKI